MIKHVSFDVWNTLIKSNPKFKKFRANYIHVKLKEVYGEGLGGMMNENFIQETFTHVSKNFDRISEISQQAVNSDFMMAFAIKQLGVPYPTTEFINDLQKGLEEIFLNELPHFTHKEDVQSMFEFLHRNNIMASVLSNTGFIPGKTMREALDMLGIAKHISFYLFSDETGFSKPSEFAFEKLYHKAMAFRRVELPEHILHIGDSPICDGAAAAFGMKFHLYENRIDEFQIINKLI